ncbi:MAG TPA: glycosyltransferase family 2 protein [Acidimicrobiales bacterium]|nr:glycosyltransferase family 2 protein [Acidimicrobiales bacterium]
MPAHDEEAYLAPAVRAVVAGLRDRGRPFEVVVVENGSTDATAAVARDLAGELAEVRVLSLSHADYGGALREGFLSATGDLVGIFDVDYYDLAFLDAAVSLAAAPDGPTVVVATKRGAGATDTRPLPRRVVTSVFSTILRVGFGLRVSDTHGMKVLRREPLVALAQACRYGTDLFDTELILRAQRSGLRAVELPVVVEELRPSRTSILRRIPRTLAGLARLRLALWRERRPATRTPTDADRQGT